MADENTAPDMTTPPLPVAPAPQPAAATFTQSDLDRVRAEAARQAHDAAWAEARKRFSSKPAPSAADAPQPRTEPNAPPPPASDPLAILKLRDDFDDATADLQLPAAQKKFLREQVMSTRPSDVAAYVAQFVNVWGTKPAATAATTPSTPMPATPAPAPAMPGAAPPATPVITGDTPLLTILRSDPSQIEALAARDPAAFAKRLVSEFRGVRVPLRR